MRWRLGAQQLVFVKILQSLKLLKKNSSSVDWTQFNNLTKNLPLVSWNTKNLE